MSDMGWTKHHDEEAKRLMAMCDEHRKKVGMPAYSADEPDCADLECAAGCPLGPTYGEDC